MLLVRNEINLLTSTIATVVFHVRPRLNFQAATALGISKAGPLASTLTVETLDRLVRFYTHLATREILRRRQIGAAIVRQGGTNGDCFIDFSCVPWAVLLDTRLLCSDSLPDLWCRMRCFRGQLNP